MSAMRKPRTKITDFEQLELSMKVIKVCPEMLQVRARTDKEVSRRYSKSRANGSVFPPVLVYRVGEDLYLADGFHRHDAWLQLGLPTIPAVIREGTMEDAILAAMEANGDDVVDRKLNEDDRRHAVELMIRNEKFRMWSDSEIIRRCGTSTRTVLNVRLKLRDEEGIPLPDRVEKISGGVPTGRTVRYRPIPGVNAHRSSDGILTHRAYFDGKARDLGNNPVNANAKFARETQEREQKKVYLHDAERFREWLGRRRVRTAGIPVGDFPLGGTVVDDIIVQSVGDVTMESFLSASCRLLLTRFGVPASRRMILVGYIRGVHTKVTSLIPFVVQAGIEIMTPEEFVAEFRPKGENDGGQGSAPSESKN